MSRCIYPAVIRSMALLAVVSVLGIRVQIILAADQTSSAFKSEHFDHDPGWEGYNNRNAPKEARRVKQDFGYSQTRFASKNAGEIGGSIQRASTPASYAAPLTPVRTLDDKLTASGTFAAYSGK